MLGCESWKKVTTCQVLFQQGQDGPFCSSHPGAIHSFNTNGDVLQTTKQQQGCTNILAKVAGWQHTGSYPQNRAVRYHLKFACHDTLASVLQYAYTYIL